MIIQLEANRKHTHTYMILGSRFSPSTCLRRTKRNQKCKEEETGTRRSQRGSRDWSSGHQTHTQCTYVCAGKIPIHIKIIYMYTL